MPCGKFNKFFVWLNSLGEINIEQNVENIGRREQGKQGGWIKWHNEALKEASSDCWNAWNEFKPFSKVSRIIES